MFRKLRQLQCKLRGYHHETCDILLMVSTNLVEHSHTCADCETVLLRQIITPNTQPPYRDLAMGLGIEDQSRFLQ